MEHLFDSMSTVQV